jgi:cell wall-associated NlpC family hydrolase
VDSSATTAARSELSALDARAAELTTRVESATADLSAARAAHEEALNAVSAATERLEAAQASFDSYVTGAYKAGPGAQAAAYLSIVDPRAKSDLASLGKLERVGEKSSSAVTDLKAARTELERARASAEAADEKAKLVLEGLNADRAELEGDLATKRTQLEALVAADTATWNAAVVAAREAEAQAARAAEAARRTAALEAADAATSVESSDGLDLGTPGDLPVAVAANLDSAASAIAAQAASMGADTSALAALPARERVVAASDLLLRAIDASSPGTVGFVGGRPQGAVAVEAALAQLGDPYVWGASGPGSFDCSGLTAWGWKAAGVGLPHYSRAQFSGQAKVGASDLRPGDLVFFGSPIHHVGMYLGGGLMVHAPHTGDVVKVAKVSYIGSYVGGSRPA